MGCGKALGSCPARRGQSGGSDSRRSGHRAGRLRLSGSGLDLSICLWMNLSVASYVLLPMEPAPPVTKRWKLLTIHHESPCVTGTQSIAPMNLFLSTPPTATVEDTPSAAKSPSASYDSTRWLARSTRPACNRSRRSSDTRHRAVRHSTWE